MRITILAGLLAIALAGCGRDAPPVSASSAAAMQVAQARVGDVAIHASVVQTSMLDDAIARQYGLARSDRVAMLLVSARRDGDAPLPASLTIDAKVADATGSAARPIALRAVTVDGLVDYVGTVDIAPPERLRFDIVATYGTATASTQFSRDFYPR